MPAWDDYKAEAKSRGALAFQLYVAQSIPAGDPKAVKASLPDHLAYLAGLEKDGVLALAGPLSDETGEQMEGMGMLVLRAESFEHARELAANDPMHRSGARTFTLRKWLINEGSLTVTIGLSSQSVELS
ncbi:MAG: hypothetical protein KJN93_00605 [Alphaproteobacteria bacterium]|nr:hypothetical protein [Alphaproteobacteria bacterium]